jgi:hypothetical protein
VPAPAASNTAFTQKPPFQLPIIITHGTRISKITVNVDYPIERPQDVFQALKKEFD